MKKVLLIFIIAVIACNEVEEKVQKEDELELVLHDLLDSFDFEDPNIVELKSLFGKIVDKVKGTFKDGVDKGKDTVKDGVNKGKEIADKIKDVINKGKDAYKKIKDKIIRAVDYLKEIGVWDELIVVAKTAGKIGAIALCSAHITPIVCGPLVEIVFELAFNLIF